MKTVKLDEADICMDCESIFDARRQNVCPGCGSGSVYPVAKWLLSSKNIPMIRPARKTVPDQAA